MREQPAKSLRQRALEYLSKREYSEAELAQKLKAYANEEDDIPALITDFKTRGWLSDTRYTEQMIHARQGKFGAARVANELREKGSITSSKGNRITRLGIHDEMDKARASASVAVKTIADNFATKIAPTVNKRLKSGDSYREIAQELNDLSVPTARGGKWHASSIRNIAIRLASK